MMLFWEVDEGNVYLVARHRDSRKGQRFLASDHDLT